MTSIPSRGEACPACDTPIQHHRMDGVLVLAHPCGHLLWGPTLTPPPTTALLPPGHFPDREAQFQARVIQYARRRGYLVYFTKRSDRSPKGFPDLVLCRPPRPETPGERGRLIFAELKSLAGRLTPEQEAWMAALKATGVESYVFFVEDYPTVEWILQ